MDIEGEVLERLATSDKTTIVIERTRRDGVTPSVIGDACSRRQSGPQPNVDQPRFVGLPTAQTQSPLPHKMHGHYIRGAV